MKLFLIKIQIIGIENPTHLLTQKRNILVNADKFTLNCTKRKKKSIKQNQIRNYNNKKKFNFHIKKRKTEIRYLNMSFMLVNTYSREEKNKQFNGDNKLVVHRGDKS